MKPGWEDEFNNEKRVYERLQPVQGHFVPILYGEATFEGSRALVLSEVNGVLPFKQEKPYLAPSEFKRRITRACRELEAFDYFADGIKLANTFLVDDRVVFVDLEDFFKVAPEKRERILHQNIEAFMDEYRRYIDQQKILDDRKIHGQRIPKRNERPLGPQTPRGLRVNGHNIHGC